MEFITKKAIQNLNDEYYENRFVYIKEVIDQIKVMDNINRTLELGPYKSPLIVDGDIMDVTGSYLTDMPIRIGKFYKHDCEITPYPIKDKQYDLVIACQVLEHLGRNQKDVFNELSRICKIAIITLPYKWNLPCDVHHMIDEKVIDGWAQGLNPMFEKIINDKILRIYYFDDLVSIEYNKKLQEHANFQLLKENRFLRNKLRNEQKKKEKMAKELKKILNSNSWKMTSIFRKLRS